MDGLRRENVSDERADGFEVLLEQNSGWNESSREGDKNEGEREREKKYKDREKERGREEAERNEDEQVVEKGRGRKKLVHTRSFHMVLSFLAYRLFCIKFRMRVFPARDTQKRMKREGRVREEKGEKRKQGMMEMRTSKDRGDRKDHDHDLVKNEVEAAF